MVQQLLGWSAAQSSRLDVGRQKSLASQQAIHVAKVVYAAGPVVRHENIQRMLYLQFARIRPYVRNKQWVDSA